MMMSIANDENIAPERSSSSEEVLVAEVIRPPHRALGVFVFVVLIADLGMRAYSLLFLPLTLLSYGVLPENHWMRASSGLIVLLGEAVNLLGIVADVLILKKRRVGVVLGWIALLSGTLLHVADLPSRTQVLDTAFWLPELRENALIVAVFLMVCILLGIGCRVGWVILYGTALIIARRRLAELEKTPQAAARES